MNKKGLKKSTVLCIIESNSKVLLLKRRKNPHKGLFIPVGGKIEPYESPNQAVVREVFEETKIKLGKSKFCGTLVETSPSDFNWINFVFHTNIDFIEPPQCDEGELFWIPIPQLSTVPSPETDIHIFNYVFQNKKFHFDALYDSEINLIYLKDELDGKILINKKGSR